jgi:hypothetical protein
MIMNGFYFIISVSCRGCLKLAIFPRRCQSVLMPEADVDYEGEEQQQRHAQKLREGILILW